jgi:3-deoxy-D-manno-octulosonic-acid transferase
MIGYRLAAGLALPLWLALGLREARRGGVGPARALAERLALRPPPGPGPVVWLHGASNGELASARWLAEAMAAARPDLAWRVTATTGTGRAAAAGWGLPALTPAFDPWDTAGAPARAARGVALHVTLEAELWPARLAALAAAGVPVVALGARLSARSAARMGRVAPGLMATTLGRLTALSAQDAGSEARLLALGLPPARLWPRLMLKAQVRLPPPRLPAPRPRAEVLLAASTHEGEEAALLDAFLAQEGRGPFRLLILAPRHPRRAEEVAALIAARGIAAPRRSAGAQPGAADRVFLADTMGEMAEWYAMAGTTFIGATLADRGGHTPFEPAAAGSALLHGPSLHNFAEAFAALDAAGGAVAVAGAAGLPGALLPLTPARQEALAAAARATITPAEGAAALVQRLVALLPRG